MRASRIAIWLCLGLVLPLAVLTASDWRIRFVLMAIAQTIVANVFPENYGEIGRLYAESRLSAPSDMADVRIPNETLPDGLTESELRSRMTGEGFKCYDESATVIGVYEVLCYRAGPSDGICAERWIAAFVFDENRRLTKKRAGKALYCL